MNLTAGCSTLSVIPAVEAECFIRTTSGTDETARSKLSGLRSFDRFLASGKTAFEALTEEDVSSYMLDMLERKASRTADLYLTHVRAFLEWLVKGGWDLPTGRSVWYQRCSKPSMRPQRTLEPKHIVEALRCADEHASRGGSGLRDSLLINLSLRHGMGPAALARLNVGDLSFEGGGAVLAYKPGKERRWEELAPHVAETAKAYLESRGRPSSSKPLIVSFSNRSRGSRMSAAAITSLSAAVLADAEIPEGLKLFHSLSISSTKLRGVESLSVNEISRYLGAKGANMKRIVERAGGMRGAVAALAVDSVLGEARRRADES